MPAKMTQAMVNVLDQWLDMTKEERVMAKLPVTINGIRGHLNIGSTTFAKYKKLHWESKDANIFDPMRIQALEDIALEERATERIKEEKDSEFDFSRWKKNMTQPMAAYLLKAAQAGKSPAIKLFFELSGEYVQKQELKVGLTGDEVARRNLEADRELRENGYRVAKIKEESTLLPEELRQDTIESTASDN